MGWRKFKAMAFKMLLIINCTANFILTKIINLLFVSVNNEK